MVTRAQMEAHGEASPYDHPTEPGDCWVHWLCAFLMVKKFQFQLGLFLGENAYNNYF